MKEVRHFGVTCQQGLDKIGAAQYGYYDYCYDSCLVFNRKGDFLRDYDCDCSHGRAFDSVFKNELSILSGYFAGLARLADPSAAISCSPIGNAVHQGTYGSMTISATEAAVTSGLATAATYLFTTGYKDRKIKDIIGLYHDSVNTALMLMMLHLDNLRSKIQLLELGLRQRGDTLVSQAQTPGDKWNLAYAYKQKIWQWDQVITSFNDRFNTLSEIRKGNDELFHRIDQLKSEGSKKSIMDLSGNISYLSGSVK
jgi:hypothetical protein